MLAERGDPRSLALRCRGLIRSGSADRALESLSAWNSFGAERRSSGELLLVKMRAAIAIGEWRIARAVAVEAKGHCYGVGSLELESEFRYYTALLGWSDGSLATVDAVASVLETESQIPAWRAGAPENYPFSRSYWRCRGLELLGMAEALRHDFEAQASYLVRAFEEYDRAECIDAQLEASMLHNLAVLVRDLQIPDIAKFVRARVARIEITDATADFRFQVVRALGWCNALKGDHLGSFRDFRDCLETAPSLPLKIGALLDRAFLARELNEAFFATEELSAAHRLAGLVDWNRCNGYDRSILLDLVRQTAAQDAPLARRLLDTYTGLAGSYQTTLELDERDRRRQGVECTSIAAVARAEGERERAAALYREAFEIWTEVGYDWRAAEVALELYGFTGEDSYLPVIAREARARPLSWMARRYEAIAR